MWFVVIYSIDRKWNWDRLLAVSMAMASAGTVQLIYWAFDTHLCTAFVKLWSGSLHDTNQESWRRNCCWYIMKWPPQWISNAICSTLPVHWRRWLWFAMSPKNYIRESILFFNDRFELWNQIFETILLRKRRQCSKIGCPSVWRFSYIFEVMSRISIGSQITLFRDILMTWIYQRKTIFVFYFSVTSNIHSTATKLPPDLYQPWTYQFIVIWSN